MAPSASPRTPPPTVAPMEPKRVSLAEVGALLGLPEGASVASVGNDATEATIYITGAASRRMALVELAGLLSVSKIAALGTSGDDLVVFADDPTPDPPPPTTGAQKKAGS